MRMTVSARHRENFDYKFNLSDQSKWQYTYPPLFLTNNSFGMRYFDSAFLFPGLITWLEINLRWFQELQQKHTIIIRETTL